MFEEYQGFVEKFGDLSVIPTRFFLGKPSIGEEMHIAIEKGKTLIIKVLAVGSVDENRGTRDVWFEVNGEVDLALLLIMSCHSHSLPISPELSPSRTTLLLLTLFAERRLQLTLALSAPPCLVSSSKCASRKTRR